MKTNELTDIALDWAVAKCKGATELWFDTVATHWIKLDGKDRALSKGWSQSFTPSTDWEQGGPIIEREGISLDQYHDFPNWAASCPPESGFNWFGPTPLIAAMRCYVASKLGDDVEIPTELLGETK